MTLVDTSVWVEHLRGGTSELAELLERGSVLMHPFVVGELACGNLRNRHEVLDLVARLPLVDIASHAEVLDLIERFSLMGRGVGYVDVHLLASARLAAPARLWTRDRRLAALAAELGVGSAHLPRAGERAALRRHARSP